MIEHAATHVLVCVADDAQADGLVERTAHLATALGCAWTVAEMAPAGTAASAPDGPPTGNTSLARALQTAAAAGALLRRIEYRGSDRRSRVDAAVTGARDASATVLLIAPHDELGADARDRSRAADLLRQALVQRLPQTAIHVVCESPARHGEARGRTVIGRLAARWHRQSDIARTEMRRSQALQQLATELVKARTPENVATALAVAAHRTLGVSAQLLAVDPEGRFDDAAQRFPIPLRLARQAVQRGTDTGAGTDIEPGLRWRCLPLRAKDTVLGVVVVDLLTQRCDAPEDRSLLKAFAGQAALALERALFERSSAQAAVAAESERLRSTLLAGLSHDFRTPLTTIIGATTSLIEQADGLSAPEARRLLRSVLAEAVRLHKLSSNLLELTRLEAGAVQPRPEWCPADELVQEALAALAPRLQRHRVDVRVADDAVVWCDPTLVGQLLVNLMDNAARHAPEAAIEVAVGLSQGRWWLSVSDDGPGVPPGQEAAVFKKFVRGAGAGGGAGSGLGLAIGAAVAELHGGTLRLLTQPEAVDDPAPRAGGGFGARFVLSLPQPDPPAATGVFDE